MDDIHRAYSETKQAYDGGGSPPIEALADLAALCLAKLSSRSRARHIANLSGKEYHVFVDGSAISRPFLPAMFLSSTQAFRAAWREVASSARPAERRFCADPCLVDRALYTAITAFCVCYDLWKPGSRKTPGTVFEVLLGSLMQLALPRYTRLKHIAIPGEPEHVSTDIVFMRPHNSGGIVIPAKITTRERIVQPFAHQRILDSVFGEGTFTSVLVCVSELQRDRTSNVNEICVPGTIRLFQRHLSSLAGIYYLDPPSRYLQTDIVSIIRIGTIGELLTSRLTEIT